MNHKELAALFKARRLELGLTQAQLAAKLEVSQSNISIMESGTHYMGWMGVMNLCKALKLTITLTATPHD